MTDQWRVHQCYLLAKQAREAELESERLKRLERHSRHLLQIMDEAHLPTRSPAVFMNSEWDRLHERYKTYLGTQFYVDEAWIGGMLAECPANPRTGARLEDRNGDHLFIINEWHGSPPLESLSESKRLQSLEVAARARDYVRGFITHCGAVRVREFDRRDIDFEMHLPPKPRAVASRDGPYADFAYSCYRVGVKVLIPKPDIDMSEDEADSVPLNDA